MRPLWLAIGSAATRHVEPELSVGGCVCVCVCVCVSVCACLFRLCCFSFSLCSDVRLCLSMFWLYHYYCDCRYA